MLKGDKVRGIINLGVSLNQKGCYSLLVVLNSASWVNYACKASRVCCVINGI